jgi:hypothetical protein
MTTKQSKVSVKLEQDSVEFFKKLRVNIIRAGGSEKALKLSYADLMEWIVKYFKFDNDTYIKMVAEVGKNV